MRLRADEKLRSIISPRTIQIEENCLDSLHYLMSLAHMYTTKFHDKLSLANKKNFLNGASDFLIDLG